MKERYILLSGIVFVFLALLSYRATYALFSDTASSTGNMFTAASIFPSLSPTTTPVETLTPTLIPSETTSPTGIPTLSPSPTVTPIQTTNLQINEFMPHPGAGDEWVEIINIGNVSINLNGWKVFDGNSTRNDDLSLIGTINPGQIMAFNHSSGWLNDSGDILNLENNLGATLSATSYVSSTIDKSTGRNPDGTGLFKTCGAISFGITNVGFC